MPTEVKFRKKEYNEFEDNESGVIIFDESKRTIYLDGVDYTQNVIDASKLRGEIPSECYKDSTLSGIAYCSTAAATAAKTATMPGFELVTGQRIFLQTTVKNSATSNVTLSVNGTEPKPIKIGTATPTTSNFPASWWIANYDGTNWVLTRIYFSNNTDTKVTQSSTTTDGYRKILLSYNSSTTIGDAITSATNVAYEAVDVEVQPSTGKILSNGFVKNGGTSSQFLKADGSVDENTYSKSSLTQTKNYTSNSAFYTNGSFTYFNSSDYITSISDVNNSYTLVEFDDTSITTTGTSINIPFNFPIVSGDLTGNENIHYFLLKNISSSNLNVILVPLVIQSVCTIGDLTPITLHANNSIEISTKVMDNNWIISKSMEMPITQQYSIKEIHYTSNDGNVVTPDGPLYENIVSNVYENGVGIITFNDVVTSIGDGTFHDCENLTSITIPKSVTNIGDGVFYNCYNLTSINIPDSVTFIGGNTFEGCKSLTSITIPNSVTHIINYTFMECTSLTSITIGNNVTDIGDGAFYNCYNLTSINIPDSVTSIGDYAFSSCSGLTSINIPDSVTSIGDGAFSDCSDLTSITIGDSVTSIGTDAFINCTGLTSIVVSEGNTKYDSRNNCNAIIETSTNKLIFGCKNTIIPDSVVSIGDNAFINCTGLTSITIPNSVASIGDGAFSDCNGLTSINIPDSVTSIGNGAFSYCTSLTSVTIGNKVESISDYAFSGCNGLTSITLLNTTPPTIQSSTLPSNTTYTIYVPSESVETYKAAQYWNSKASQIQAIQ
ncbi:leucine-rich repeat domain-containing protein [uncultured Methanobrevibacter sp.]|uniref:leucine-rich repeat domain-containing protein n=1 Tax=uncultured Methanobrevibacter sp. TaxID=253161 RepID=UPI0025E7296B|nr:leucine-rich repeat domain-containing protein [uncultured Methanobrevibacter sp.]